ncbi:hypothetical protein [Bradyrhizobium sp. DOA9]|nr:hypothetical protein [Bradyrhizobium sp. DOA9]
MQEFQRDIVDGWRRWMSRSSIDPLFEIERSINGRSPEGLLEV